MALRRISKNSTLKSCIIHLFFNSILILILCAFLGVGLLMLVYSIPVDRMIDNVRESQPIFEEEGGYPIQFWGMDKLDNFTDALMLMNVSYDGNEDVLQKALLVYRLRIEKSGKRLGNPCEALVAYYSPEGEGIPIGTSRYPRYWHGYLIILKPLFNFFNYQTIRIINLFFQLFLDVGIIVLLWVRKMQKWILPYVLTVFALVPPALAMSLQYSDIFYIYSISLVVLLLKNEQWKESCMYCYFFLIIGIATAYFDFLTYPLVALGIPLIFFIIMNREAIKKDLFKVFSASLFFGEGYIGMWSIKWILASIFTSENVILMAWKSFLLRSSMDVSGNSISYLDVIRVNIGWFARNPIVILSFVYVLCMFIHTIRHHKNITYEVMVFGIIALMPFLWYLLASQHSYVHAFFTNRELAITFLAGISMFVEGNTKVMSL